MMEHRDTRTVRKIFHPKEGTQEEGNMLRVAAYCRVSRLSEEQHTSFDTQVAVYTQRISEEPGWTLAGIYADRGVPGTQAERRPQFLNMIRDCEEGKIDLIICKSISRFSRNTLDSVKYIRHLQDCGVRLIFEKEGIDTGCAYSEMLLTVLAAFAQEESRSMSENIKWGKRKRAEQGQPPLLPLYGYRKNPETGNYEIIPEEAEVVRRVFDAYEHGVSISRIVEDLLRDGIKPPNYSRTGSEKWIECRIQHMLENEKYAGDIQTMKYYKESFMHYRMRRNNGVIPSTILYDHHEAIVPREQFERCNVIIGLRKKHTHLNYPFGDYMHCPYCGHILHQRQLRISKCMGYYCCEGEGACRGFAILSSSAKEAVRRAYRDLDEAEIERLTGSESPAQSEAAKRLLREKREHPEFDSVEYWWVDSYMSQIVFGQHSHTNTELKALGAHALDDRTITIYWKCGLETTFSSGVLRDSEDPRHKARMWNSHILRYPERYPDLAEEAQMCSEQLK